MAHQNGWILLAEVKVNDEIYNPNVRSEYLLTLSQLTIFFCFLKIPAISIVLGRDLNVHL